MSSKPSVAIFGTSGFLGTPTIDAFSRKDLQDNIQFPIKAVTSNKKSKQDSSTVQYVEGDILSSEGQKKIIESLQGIDVIIELLGFDPKLFAGVESIVKQVKPKLFIPSQFGVDIGAAQELFPGFLQPKVDHSNNIRKLGVKLVDIYTSLFAAKGAFLYEIVGHAGIDPNKKTVTYYGNADTKVSFSNTTDIGNSIASVAATEPSKLPDLIRIESGKVSYKEIAQKYEKDHNVKLTENHIDIKEELAKAQQKYAKVNISSGEDFLYYLHVLGGQGAGKGVSFTENDNELVNPGGKLFSWSKY